MVPVDRGGQKWTQVDRSARREECNSLRWCFRVIRAQRTGPDPFQQQVGTTHAPPPPPPPPHRRSGPEWTVRGAAPCLFAAPPAGGVEPGSARSGRPGCAVAPRPLDSTRASESIAWSYPGPGRYATLLTRARNLQARGEGVGMRCRRPKTTMHAKVTSARPITERAIVTFWFQKLIFPSGVAPPSPW